MITALWSSQIFRRPRLVAASARTGAEKDAAGVAAPGDTKVSDAMAYGAKQRCQGRK